MIKKYALWHLKVKNLCIYLVDGNQRGVMMCVREPSKQFFTILVRNVSLSLNISIWVVLCDWTIQTTRDGLNRRDFVSSVFTEYPSLG